MLRNPLFLASSVLLSLLACASAANSQTLLAPGEIGIFLDSGATQRVGNPGYFQPAFIVARLDDLGLSRVQFAVGTSESGVLQQGWLINAAGDIVDSDPTVGRLDLTMPAINAAPGDLVVLATIIQTYGSNAGLLRILPHAETDLHPLVTSGAPGATARRMNWRVPPWKPRHDYLADPSSILLTTHQEAALISTWTGGDRGDVVHIELSFPYYGISDSSGDPYNFEFEPGWPSRDLPECSAWPPQPCCLCQELDWVEAQISWDPAAAIFEGITAGPDVPELPVTVVSSGPDSVSVRIDGVDGIHYYDRVFELDLRLTAESTVTDLRTTSAGSELGFESAVFGLIRGGRIVAGCELYDVVDDDVVNQMDAGAILDMIVGTLPVEDERVCRADVDHDGLLTPADAMLTLREAEQLGPGVPGADGAGYEYYASSPQEVLISVDGVAAARFDFATTLATGSPVSATTGTGVVSARVGDDGRIHLAMANSLGGTANIALSVSSGSLADLTVLAAVGYDETGIEVALGKVTSTPPVATQVFTLGTAAPNPFNPSVRLAYTATEPTRVHAVVFDVRGRRVRDLGENRIEEGTGWLHWDGRDDSGRLAPSGSYRVIVQAADVQLQRAVTLLK